MPLFAPRKRLERVTKAQRSEMDLWAEGIDLQAATGRTLDELRDHVTADRIELAAKFGQRARKLLLTEPPMYRDAISRGYYAMYHAWRAVAFFSTGGDDHEGHAKLPGVAPPGFSNVARWQNVIKDARLTRNNADYESYPKSDRAWQAQATQLVHDATDLIRECRAYLRARGCKYL